MKLTLLFIFICLTIGCATTNKTSNILNGIWTPIKQEIGGKELPMVFIHFLPRVLTRAF